MQEITDMQKKGYKNQINKNEAKREKSNLNNRNYEELTECRSKNLQLCQKYWNTSAK